MHAALLPTDKCWLHTQTHTHIHTHSYTSFFSITIFHYADFEGDGGEGPQSFATYYP